MKCEFTYCIYNHGKQCAFGIPLINSLGVCDNCIIISLDEDFLEKEKLRQLEELEGPLY